MTGTSGGAGAARPPSPFDRVRPRRLDVVGAPELSGPAADPDGKRALFSTTPAVPALGSVTVECSRCGGTSVLSLLAALRQAVPSLYLPVLGGRHPHYARCPACRRYGWLRARVRL